MAKKKFGKFVAFATISGVVAAGISYFLKYKSFNDELEEDFHDFEGEEDEFNGELPHEHEAPARTYVSLNGKEQENPTAEVTQETAAVEKDVEKAVEETSEEAAAIEEEIAVIEEDDSLL